MRLFRPVYIAPDDMGEDRNSGQYHLNIYTKSPVSQVFGSYWNPNGCTGGNGVTTHEKEDGVLGWSGTQGLRLGRLGCSGGLKPVRERVAFTAQTTCHFYENDP